MRRVYGVQYAKLVAALRGHLHGFLDRLQARADPQMRVFVQLDDLVAELHR